MNEWGLPDWRDAFAYGEPEQWDLDRWRWEFSRRREDLRGFFDRWAHEERSVNATANEGRCPSDPGYLAFAGEEAEITGLELFGYAGVPNPRIGNQPKVVIMPIEDLVRNTRYYDPRTRTPLNIREMSIFGEVRGNKYQLTLENHEFAIKFDLNRPLSGQIEEAKKVLKAKQIKLHGNALQRRRHTSKWLSYLRTLDAREAGASLADIASLHPNTAQHDQSARDILAQARALCFNF